MAKKTEKKTRKGIFGAVRLPVASGYVMPRSIAMGIRLGLGLGLVFLVLYAAGASIGPREFVSGGRVSSSHAMFESQCWRCHEPFRSASDAACSSCHEKFQDPIGTYSHPRHVLYRSVDLGRIETAAKERKRSSPACESCHLEHRGRDAVITDLADRNCTACHAGGAFHSKHPEFAFRRDSVADDSTLHFTHVRHTGFVMKRAGSVNVEKACLYCHVPAAEGMSFQPISYDAHCAECHLTDDRTTPLLTLADPQDPAAVGVMSPAMLQSQGGARLAWASRLSQAEFNMIPARNAIRKLRIVHRDPWILENLRFLRARAFGTSGLGDLLDTDGLASNETVKDLGRDAVNRLRTSLTPLRGRPEPEVRRDAVTMESLLVNVENRLKAPGPAGLSADLFAHTPRGDAPGRARTLELIDDLTSECRLCHVIRNASVARVQKDQRSLTRAHFDHRAHILDRSCLDCHREIPFAGDSTMTEGFSAEQELSRFPSSIQNLPGIENCRKCHAAGKVSDACITCHDYHPDKSNRANLLLTAPQVP